MFTTRFFICAFCLTALFSLEVSGQGQQYEAIQEVNSEAKAMTLHDCMEYAISNSTKIKIQRAEVGDAQIVRRDAALALFTPKISAQTYAYYNFGRSIDPQTNTYFNTTSFHNNYGVSLGYDLFNGFEAVNNYKVSKTGMLIANSQEKQAEADICLAIMESYYNVVYYKRLCEIYEKQVATAEQALNKARRQEEVGQKGHAYVIDMEAELAERQYELTNALNMYRDQKMTLADLMFWPADEELNIAVEGSQTLDDPALQSEESIVAFALEHNPGVQIAHMQQSNAMRTLNTAKWQLLPSVGLYAGWSTNYYSYHGASTPSFGEQFRNNRGEYVEFVISIPIWDRLSRHSQIAKRRNAYDKATLELMQKRRDVESEVRRAYQDMNGALVSYRQAQRKAEVQREAYSLNLKKLEQGLISPIEFQTANNNYLRAQSDEMSSLFKYLIKRAVVRYYNGVEYIEQSKDLKR